MPIPMKDAKEQLKKINDCFSNPLILVGGLAVNQYIARRLSDDIDLVCDFSDAITILSNLYGDDSNWSVEDFNQDEERPIYQMRNRSTKSVIVFGPKILERVPYNYIQWEMIKDGAKPFRFMEQECENILVPTAAALAFMKVISFICRSPLKEEKIRKDAEDLKALSNNKLFSLYDFKNFISQSKAAEFISSNFFSRMNVRDYIDILEKISFIDTTNIFFPHTRNGASSIRTAQDYEKYLIGSKNERALIIAHCPPHGIFENYSVLSPGGELLTGEFGGHGGIRGTPYQIPTIKYTG